jgi:rod shape determining protein RodA
MNISEKLRAFDWVMTLSALMLAIIGLAMVFSLTSTDTNLFSPRFIKQSIFLGIALTAFVLASFFPYHSLRRYHLLIYIITVTGLLIASGAGRLIRGTTSRLEVLGLQLQPSEFVKIALVITLAWIFSQSSLKPSRKFFLSIVFTGLVVGLVFSEPDLGEASLIFLLWLSLIIFAGLPWRILFSIFIACLIFFIISWQWFLADYQKSRLVTFINPAHDPQGAGYNITQSIVAIGSGGLLGRGLGHGPQSQLQFLPERQTDFIFASTGEELGFFGLMLFVLLYSVMLWRAIKISIETRDIFGKYLVVGTFFLFLISFFVSAGMNTGLLPVTGIPLPLISYGGSNLVSSFILLGLAQSVHVNGKWLRQPPTELEYLS